MFVSAGFTFEEVQQLTLSQIKLLSAAIGRKVRNDSVNTMTAVRVGYHAEQKEFSKILKDMRN